MPPASTPSPSGARQTPCCARRWMENVQWGMKAWSGNHRRRDLPMITKVNYPLNPIDSWCPHLFGESSEMIPFLLHKPNLDPLVAISVFLFSLIKPQAGTCILWCLVISCKLLQSHTGNSRRSRPDRTSVADQSQSITCQLEVGRKCIMAVGLWLWFWGPSLCR